MSCIVLTHAEWRPIFAQLKEEYKSKPSVFLLRDAMKRELGFTVREHREWVHSLGHHQSDIRLDFYTESAHSWFRLKYL